MKIYVIISGRLPTNGYILTPQFYIWYNDFAYQAILSAILNSFLDFFGLIFGTLNISLFQYNPSFWGSLIENFEFLIESFSLGAHVSPMHRGFRQIEWLLYETNL